MQSDEHNSCLEKHWDTLNNQLTEHIRGVPKIESSRKFFFIYFVQYFVSHGLKMLLIVYIESFLFAIFREQVQLYDDTFFGTPFISLACAEESIDRNDQIFVYSEPGWEARDPLHKSTLFQNAESVSILGKWNSLNKFIN